MKLLKDCSQNQYFLKPPLEKLNLNFLLLQTSKLQNLVWLFILTMTLSSCQEHPKVESIYGVWGISNFTTNGFDQTEIVNQDFTKWLEFTENGQFRSGSMKIDHIGQWAYNAETGVLKFTSKAEAWGNTTWQVQGHSSNLHFRRIDVVPSPLTSVLFTRMEKIPTITKYVRNELDQFTGLWQIDSTSHKKRVDEYQWIRLRRIGVLEFGNELGQNNRLDFTYDSETNILTAQQASNSNIHKWEIEWDDDKLVFSTPETNKKMYMSRVEEFMEDED